MRFPVATPIPGLILILSILWIASNQAPAQAPPNKEKPPAKDLAPPKEMLLKAGSGPSREEAAIARGLAWLARQQREDGSWQFDAPNAKDQSYQVAATGLALLPFLEIGEGPTNAIKYRTVAKKGVDWLASWDKGFIAKNMYAQAIATIALCDAYRLSKDDKLKAKATLAVEYIVKAQGKNGSWGYRAGAEGDTTIVGWQVVALVAADAAGIGFDKEKVYRPANKFLDGVSDSGGATYGYRERGKSWTTTAMGLLSRLNMGDITAKDETFVRGAKYLIGLPPDDRLFDTHHWYFATQVLRHRGGDDWQKIWKPKLRNRLCDIQDTGDDKSSYGSWRKDDGHIGAQGGRLGTTCFAILALEILLRKAPDERLKELEK
jgi:hypothetical protein